MTRPSSPDDTAHRMIDRYGVEPAREYAYGYATGQYFEQTNSGKDYWLAVCESINRIACGRPPRRAHLKSG